MDYRRQPGRPAPRTPQAEQPTTPVSIPASSASSRPQRQDSGKKRFVVSALIAVALLSAGFALGKLLPVFEGEYGRVDNSKHQAVFLTNDQVYFGKITAITDDVVVMENIYYLQNTGNQAADDAKQEATSPTQQSNMSLAKLGNELHAPEDRMQINKEQVLFWENLKDDGKVSQAIKENQEQE